MSIEKQKLNKPWWQPAMELFIIISGWIVFPILIALFLGKYLDERFDKAPMFLIICFSLAFVVTNVGLILNTIKAAKKIDQQTGDKEKKEK